LSRSSPHYTSGGPERTTKRKIDTGRVPVKSNKKRKQQRKKHEDSFQDRDRHTPESDELRALAGPYDVPSLRLKLAKLEGKLETEQKENGFLKEQIFTYKSQAENWEDKWEKERELSKTLMSCWPRRSRLVSKLNSARPTWPVRSSCWSGSLDPVSILTLKKKK